MPRIAEEDNWSHIPPIMDANKVLSIKDIFWWFLSIFLSDQHLAEDYAESSNCKQAKFSWVGHNHLGKTFVDV